MTSQRALPINVDLTASSKNIHKDNSAHVLSNIYHQDVALTCFSNKASWATSQAAKLFSRENIGTLIHYQGPIDQSLMVKIAEKFDGKTHASLLLGHIELMLDMFSTLFEPEEIGIRILACNEARSPDFHRPKNIVRMVSTLGGTGEQWVSPEHIKFMPLKPRQLSPAIQQPDQKYIHELQNGDIALMKGTQWQEHEDSAITCASPLFLSQENKLCIYIDLIK